VAVQYRGLGGKYYRRGKYCLPKRRVHNVRNCGPFRRDHISAHVFFRVSQSRELILLSSWRRVVRIPRLMRSYALFPIFRESSMHGEWKRHSFDYAIHGDRSRRDFALEQCWPTLTGINQITGICSNNQGVTPTANDNVSRADCRGLKLRLIYCNADESQDKYNEIHRLRVLVACRFRETEWERGGQN